jgi:hypothetical protein
MRNLRQLDERKLSKIQFILDKIITDITGALEHVERERSHRQMNYKVTDRRIT